MKPQDWIGGFAQFNYTTDKMNLYGMGGVSSIEYSYQDWFTVEQELVKGRPNSNLPIKRWCNV